MPVKTYTREVWTVFTQEELKDILKQAHEYCKEHVPRVRHKIGRKRQRTVWTRPREQYQQCIRNFIEQKIKEREGR